MGLRTTRSSLTLWEGGGRGGGRREQTEKEFMDMHQCDDSVGGGLLFDMEEGVRAINGNEKIQCDKK